MSTPVSWLNAAAPHVLDALWHASLVGAGLAAAVLLARAALGDRLSPGLRGTLWTLVLLRLLLPYSPEFSLSVNRLPPHADVARLLDVSSPGPSGSPGRDAAVLNGPAAPVHAAGPAGQAPRAAAPAPLSTPALIVLIYLAGVVASGTLLLVGVARAARLVRRATQLADQSSVRILEDAKRDLGVAGPVMLAQSPDCPSPVVVGMLRPVILLPDGLAQSLSEAEMRDLILHELAHVKRRDILLAWLWSLARVLHWFNPLVYAAAWCVRVDREPACDRLALSRLGPRPTAAYGRTLLKLVEALPSPARAAHSRRAFPAHAAVVEAFADESLAFKGRIRMIAEFRPSRPRPLAGALLTLLLGAVVVCTFTRSPASAQPPIAEFSHFSYDFTGYIADENAMVHTGPGTRLEVLARDAAQLRKPPKADAAELDRVTLVVVDADKRPLVARLRNRDALQLRADLAQAIASRAADLANPALKDKLAPEPAGPEFSMSKDRLTIRMDPGPDGVSPFTIGRIYTAPSADDQPHLCVEATFETVITGGTMAWVARARLPIAAARQLLADLEAALTLRNVALPALKPPVTAKSIRAKAGADLKYAFNLGGGLASANGWILGSSSTSARVEPDGRAVRLRFFDPARREMADEPVVDFRLSKAEARELFTSLKAAADAPFDLDAWAADAAQKLKKPAAEIVKSVQADEAARQGAVRLNINRRALEFVANSPPYADPSQVVSAHPRGVLDATRVCLMLSAPATRATSQNCTMIAYMTVEAAKDLATQVLKAAAD